MKTLKILLLVFCTISLNAQTNYSPMAVEGATWFMEYFNEENEAFTYYAYHIHGDVTWNGKDYKKIYFIPARDFKYLPDFHPDWSYVIGYIRDDIDERKVYLAQYVLDNGTGDFCDPESEEFLFYDFNLTTGDKFPICDKPDYIQIESEGIDTFFSYERRYLGYENNNHKIIEGIGNTRDLFTKYLIVAGYANRIISYCIGDFDLCYFGIPTGVNDVVEELKIYPNPAGDYITIDNVSPQTQYTITDYLGRLMQQGTIGNGSVNIQTLTSNVYFIRLQNAAHKFWVAKLVKE